MVETYQFDAAADYSLAQLSTLVTEAFRGYALPVHESAVRLARLVRMQGLDLAHSVVLRTSSGQLVGVSFLGLRNSRAWISAFGVIPAYRGRGLAHRLLERVIEQARSAGAQDVRLEVLVNNAVARRVYARSGFRVQRDLVTMERAPWSAPLVRSTDLRVDLVDVQVAVRYAVDLETTQPCWQREAPSLITGSAAGVVVRSGSRVVGSALHSTRDGAIALHHIAAQPGGADRAVGAVVTHLIGNAATAGRHVTLLNEPDPGGLLDALAAQGFRETMRQLELRKEL